MTQDKNTMQTLIKIASTGVAIYGVVSTIRQARADKDGLQTLEAVMRAGTLAISVIIIVRSLRGRHESLGELPEGTTA
jgi:hypothetical protein